MKKIKLAFVFCLAVASQSLYAQQNWDTDGNSINAGDFLGTTNAKPLLFKSGGNSAMLIKTDGNVGIGSIFETYPPYSLLQLGGPDESTFFTISRRYKIGECLFDSPWNIINKSPNPNSSCSYIPATSRLNFAFAGYSPTMSLSYQNVGIRDEDPTNRLTINSDVDPSGGGGVLLKRTSNTAQSRYGIGTFSGSKGLNFEMSSAGTTPSFSTALFLKEDGKIGVGFTKPEAKVHIMQETNSGAALTLEFDKNSSQTTQYSDILFKDNSPEGNENWIIRGIGHQQGDVDQGSLRFWSPNNPGKVTFLGNVFEDMKIGVGTNNPSASMHIKQLKNFSEMLKFEINSSSVAVSKYSDVVFKDPDVANSQRNWVIRAIGHGHSSTAAGNLEIWSPETNGKVTFLGSTSSNIKIGVGISDPNTSLHILQEPNVSSALKLEINNGSASASKAVDIIFSDPNLGGTQRNWVIRGHGQQWSGANPGLLEFWSPEKAGKVSFMGTGGIKVGIGTENFVGSHSLYVKGSMIAEEVFVKLYANWPDYVFEPTYNLPSIEELDKYIRDNKHLPDVMSAGEIEESGVPTGEMLKQQMQKIEELTLYIIELNNRIKQLETINNK